MGLTALLILLTFFLLLFGIIFRNTLMIGLALGAVGLVLLYWIVKRAVKSALEEYDREKGQGRG